MGLIADIEAVEDQGENSNVKDREVLDQDPKAGEQIKEGSKVTIKINVKPQEVPAPGLVGKTLEQAKILLDQAGLLVGRYYKSTIYRSRRRANIQTRTC